MCFRREEAFMARSSKGQPALSAVLLHIIRMVTHWFKAGMNITNIVASAYGYCE
jgi:hypothetical protein